ncbi:pilus assembly protein PilM [Betaproteobacteria bacterium]|nr:pilus assembly protein PilM [Betaproteobacteria bacterium]GHT92163.1 pilus assembly protein PilM [Betaproteobacteria bacterium]GHU01351.1 pilus assembly protein PilM [Betaproteobacteria bacterium]GHU17335.1 pilus assembly protein PilM [Betaproteobacteria bacterium]
MIDISLLSSRSRQLAGLDISSSSVKLVELSANDRGGLRIERYVIELLPRDAVVDGDIANFDGVADGIRRALRRFGSNPKNVAVALPVTFVSTKKIVMPDGLRELDMELQVESEAAQYIPFALDEVNIDFQVIGPAGTPGDIEVLVAAARKDKVEDRIGVAEAAGLKVAVVDVESFAIEAAFELVVEQLPNSARGKLVGLVNIGASSTTFTVLRDGQRLYSREQQFGGNQLTQDIARQFGMSTEEAESAKRGDNLPPEYSDLLRPFMDSVALEVSRALQFFFTSTQYNAVDYLVLAGGCAVIPGLAEIVGGRTQVQTIVANPFSDMAQSSKLASKKLQAEAPSLMAACGLALRRFDE